MADISVIGSGFSGLAAASILAAKGNSVTVFEKNDSIGGRARSFSEAGFTFDMGPSWYWMPDVFERYFNLFGKTTADFYSLVKLDPGFRIIFGKEDYMDVPADFESLCNLFEQTETNAGCRLKQFINQAEQKYSMSMNSLVFMPALSVTEFFKRGLIPHLLKLQLFSSFRKHVRNYFRDPRLLAIIEFPVLFLGAMPKDIPAMYSLMNYAGLKQGTWYPLGGFGTVVKAFEKIAIQNSVEIRLSESIKSLKVNSGLIKSIITERKTFHPNAVLASADYHHVENTLLPGKSVSYKPQFWEKKIFAPSCLIFYLGVKKKLKHIRHHNLFFDEEMESFGRDIYTDKQWPAKPLFYLCCPSKTDTTVAPEGCENLFILMPVATGLSDTPQIREFYFNLILKRIENFTGEMFQNDIVFKRSYSLNDFSNDYNAYKGNAYGLANTLFQTAIYKPKIRSKKVKNLFYAGQLTVPGPGVPPSVISGQVAANEMIKYLTKK